MKGLTQLIAALLLVVGATNLYAQNSIKTSIYFASGKHQLDAQALTDLQQFLKESQQLSDFDLDLKAYTDDVGSAKYNEGLAKRRAKSIQDFLGEKQIIATKTDVQNVGEIALMGEEDIELERQNNRRVDIVLSPFAPQSLDDFFSYLSNRDYQEYTVDNESEIMLMGKKGTQIKIPATAFRDADGNVITDVKITLKEAYSYEDMLQHNLATMSGERILETGGMIYIDAQTADGQKLKLAEGTAIDISMPSAKPLPSDMQLFLAARNSADQNLDWAATGTPFKTQTAATTTKPPRQRAYLSAFNLKRIDIEAIEDFYLPDLPTLMQPPTKPTAPKKAFQSRNPEPTMEWVLKKYKRNKAESRKKYEVRTAEIFAKRMEVYQTLAQRNADRRAAYSKDSTIHEQRLLDYASAVDKYNSYLEEFEPIATELFEMRDSIIAHVRKCKKSGDDSFADEYKRMRTYIKSADNYKEYIQQHCSQWGLTNALASLQDLDLTTMDSLRQNLKYWGACALKLKKNEGYWKNYHPGKSKESTDLKEQRVKGLFSLQGESIPSATAKLNGTTGEDLEILIRGIYNNIDHLHRVVDKAKLNAVSYNKIIENNDMTLAERGVKSYQQALDKLYSQIIDEKAEKGLLSDTEIQRSYMNVVSSTGLGWINCDRFYSVPAENKMMLALNYKPTTDVKFYVVFKNINSILTLDQSAAAYTRAGVPKGEAIKLIGIKASSGRMETFTFEGTTDDVADLEVKFETKKLSEIRSLLANA